MSEMALQLIRQAKAEGWKTLDLGNTGIVGEVPAEIWELTELEELILSEEWMDWENGRQKSKNSGPKNNIFTFLAHPPKIDAVSSEKSTRNTSDGLRRLTKLVMAHVKIADIQPLANLSKLQYLHLAGTEVVDIQPLANLYDLQYLFLTETQVTDIQPIVKFSNLQHLELTKTQVADIRPLANLSNLQTLFIENTQVADIRPLANLSNLQSLFLDNTRVIDIQPLANLSNLQVISLHNTLVADIQPLANLTKIQCLFLNKTQIADIQTLANLSNLELLDLSETSIANIQPLINVSNLLDLNLYDTKVADIQTLASLTKLQELYLANTQVADIQPLANLSNLQELDLDNTHVSDIHPLKLQLQNGLRLSVENCPLANPPYDYALQGNQGILNYWHRRDFDGELPLNEAKVILLGQGAAGKTSLVRHFFGEPFSKKQLQTNGILIRKKQQVVGKEKEEVLVRFWDFGGQEVMHATHKFFLTRRATYLIVLDARKDDKEVEYWLEHVRLYGGDSPVLIAVNKIDENPGFALNEAGLKKKYGEQIKGFYRISCSKKTGIKELEKALYAEISDSEDTHTPMPKPWRLIKDEMEALSEDYVGYDRFRTVCRQHGINEVGEQDTVLTLLNDLGIALKFDALKAYNRAVLKPEWLTQAVYRIINAHQTAEQFGAFLASEVGRLLNDRKYGKDKVDPAQYTPDNYEFIGEVMRIFELCYPLAPNKQDRAYMIPELLKVEEDDGGFVTDGCARLTISYPGFLPPSVFPRFIVQMHPWLVKEYCWRTGVRLHYAQEGAEGLVKLDRQDRKIEIWTSGSGGRRLMEFIRDTFAGLHSDFEGLVAQELVPLKQGQFVSYLELLGHERGNRPMYFNGVLNEEFPVKDLLDPIESAQRREENLIPVDVFVSYSHQYPEHKDKFVSHMSAYTKGKKVKVWEDGQILPGQPWVKEIWNAHGRAQIVVCLISAEFIQSDYCNDKEFMAAIEKEAAEEADVILVQVEACLWKEVPAMAAKQIIPSKPVASYENVNDGWFEVVKALEPIIEKWHQRINSGRPPFGKRGM